MAEPLDGCRAKLDRADEHLDLFEREIDAFLEDESQSVALSIPYLDPESGYHIVYAVVESDPPLRLGVILGDVVHNVRSALDHLVWQLVLANGETPGRGNAFPIVDHPNDFAGKAAVALKGVTPGHRAVIESVQPYHGSDGPETTYLGLLRHLSNVDKHQVVHTTLAVLLDPGERISARVVRGPGRVAVKQFMPLGAFEHGAELLRFKVEPLTPDTEVDVDGDVPGGIAIGERRARLDHVKHLPQVARIFLRQFEGDPI
jgi:hypothetical protein